MDKTKPVPQTKLEKLAEKIKQRNENERIRRLNENANQQLEHLGAEHSDYVSLKLEEKVELIKLLRIGA